MGEGPRIQPEAGAPGAAGTWSRQAGGSRRGARRVVLISAGRSILAGGRPQVDPALLCVAVDLGELIGVEVEPAESGDVLLELRNAASPEKGGGDAFVAQRPGDRELGEGLATPAGDLVQRADAGEILLAQHVLGEIVAAAGPRVLLDALEIPV